jgi:hypothetical protein
MASERPRHEVLSMAAASRETMAEFIIPMAKEIIKVSKEMSKGDHNDYLSALAASLNMGMHQVMSEILIQEPELRILWPEMKRMLVISLERKIEHIDRTHFMD